MILAGVLLLALGGAASPARLPPAPPGVTRAPRTGGGASDRRLRPAERPVVPAILRMHGGRPRVSIA